MAVFRVEKNRGYTVMSNHHLRNPDLSLKAKGLLSQMLSLPENWDYTLKGLSSINKESIDAIRTAVWELEKAGYITRRQGRDDKGKMTAIEYTIYEQPQPPQLENPTTDNPVLENPMSDNPTTENPVSENPTQLNKELSSKELSNTDLLNTHSIPILSKGEAAQPQERKGNGNTNIGVDELTGDVEQYADFFKATEQASPAPVGFEKIESGAKGYYSQTEKRIAINEGMSELQNLKTLIHEIAHAKLHDIDLNAPAKEQADRPDRRTREVFRRTVQEKSAPRRLLPVRQRRGCC